MHLASLWPPFEGVLGDQAEQPGQQWWVIKSNGFRTPAKLLILTLSQRLKHVHGFITSSVKCNFLDSLEDTNQSLQKSWQGLLFPLDDLPSHYSQLPIVYLTGSWNSQVIPNFIKNSNLLSCMWENNTFHDSISYVHRGENGSKQLVWLIQNLGKLLKKDNQKNFKTQSTKLRHPTQLGNSSDFLMPWVTAVQDIWYYRSDPLVRLTLLDEPSTELKGKGRQKNWCLGSLRFSKS